MKTFSVKNKFLLITYAAALLFLVFRFDFVAAGLKNILRIFSPFFIGIALAFILNQPMVFFKKLYGKKIKKESLVRGLSILTVYILFFVAITAIILFIIPEVIKNISSFISKLDVYVRNLQVLAAEITSKYDLEMIDLNALLVELNDILKDFATYVLNYLAELLPKILTMTTNIVSVIFNAVISLVVSINLLGGKEKLLYQGKKLAYTYLSLKKAKKLEKVVKLSSDIFGKYVVGQLTEACVLGILCFLGMSIFRFNYAILISTMIAVTALIPVVGAWLGGGISFVLLALTSPLRAVFFLIYLTVLQQLENSLIYPRIVGKSIGLPGLWVLFAVTVGGGMFGLPGVILGVPVMAIIYTLIGQDIKNKEGGNAKEKKESKEPLAETK